MYSQLEKEELHKIIDVGEKCVNLMRDVAHNSTPENEEFFLELDDREWGIISKWEKHFFDSFRGLIDDIKFDLGL